MHRLVITLQNKINTTVIYELFQLIILHFLIIHKNRHFLYKYNKIIKTKINHFLIYCIIQLGFIYIYI